MKIIRTFNDLYILVKNKCINQYLISALNKHLQFLYNQLYVKGESMEKFSLWKGNDGNGEIYIMELGDNLYDLSNIGINQSLIEQEPVWCYLIKLDKRTINSKSIINYFNCGLIVNKSYCISCWIPENTFDKNINLWLTKSCSNNS